MRLNAVSQLKGGLPRFRWQRILTHLAGARGEQDGTDWILPLQSDPEFAEQMVNPVQAPSYNRHWVADGNTLVQGGAQLNLVDTTDKLNLACIDEWAAIWDEMSVRMCPLQIPGDDAGGDDPIKGVLFVDPLVWDALLTDTTANANIRTWQAAALERASYGNLARHPLFAGKPFFWNGVLVRKMSNAVRFSAGATVKHVAVGNRLTGTETDITVAAGLSTTHQVARSIFLGAQALAMCSGGNQTSEETYSLLENRTNFARNLEMAGEIIGAEQKLRWALPNSSGDLEATDFGVAIIDSVVRKRAV